MNREIVITEDFLSSGKPVLTAYAGINSLDMLTGILYKQTQIPFGKNYVQVGKYYYQPIASGGGGSPTGPAGGDLSGTYPNPDVVNDSHTHTPGVSIPAYPTSLPPSDGDKGDITVSGSGVTWTIDNDVVTYAKMQNVSAASRLLGRGDSGSGDVQELSLGTGLSISGTTLNAAISTGTVTNVSALTLGTTGTDLSSSVANPTTTPVITLNVPTASASNRGALSSSDWTSFNSKPSINIMMANIAAY